MSKKILIILFIFSFKQVAGQPKITGQILEIVNSNEIPLPGASVYFSHGFQGVFSDTMGYFSINL